MKLRLTLVAGLSICASPTHAEATKLGRLLLTPEQRIALEHESHQGSRSTPEPAYLTGLVRRSRGPESRWVDGRPASENPHENISENLIHPAAGQADRALLQGGRILVHPGTRP